MHVMRISITSILILCLSIPVAAADESPSIQPLSDEDRHQLQTLSQEWIGDIEAQHRQRPTPPMTPEDVLAAIPSPQSPERIFQWLRDHIDFEPYSGALRGPEGVLISGRANAADLALLSYTLLDEAGHHPRYLTGRLYEADAERILDDVIGQATLNDRGGNAFSADDGPPPPHRADIIGELMSHLWVDVEVGGTRRAFDPLSSPSFGITPATDASPVEEFPERQMPSLTMTLVSHLDDGREQEHLIVDGPAKRLAFRSMTIAFHPDDSRVRGMKPILSIDDQTLQGDTIPVADVEHLELRFRFQSDRHENRWRQVLYRADQGMNLFDADHQHIAIAIAPGQTSDAQVIQSSTDASIQALTAFGTWLDATSEDPDELLADRERRRHVNAIFDSLGAALPFAMARFLDRSVDDLANYFGVLPIIDRPRVFTAAIVRRGESFEVDLQIDGDRLGAMPRQGIPQLSATTFLGLQGILRDSMINAILGAYGDNPDTTVHQIFEQASHQNASLTTIDASNLSDIDSLPIGEATSDHLRRQIRDRDMVLLAPESMVTIDGIERFGWWAFAPFNGNIEGHTSDALAALDADASPSTDIGARALLRNHLQMISRHYGATVHATDNEKRFPELICQASSTFSELSRRVCASGQPLESPNVVQCLTSPPRVQPDLFNPQNIDCETRLGPTRCAASFAATMLQGDLLVDHRDDAISPPSSPICP